YPEVVRRLGKKIDISYYLKTVVGLCARFINYDESFQPSSEIVLKALKKLKADASVLTSEYVKEIRSLKNKVSAYMIVRDYHINKNRISDIWDDNEHLQQSEDYVLADIHYLEI
ncbi:7125_t:CDS:2, partial [Funneliformis geosporum]